MPRTETTDGNELETRVERLERLAGVEGVLPTTRRQFLTGLGGLVGGALVGRSAVDTAVADNHGAGVLGAPGDRVSRIYVAEDFGPTMSVDTIDGGVSGLSQVDSLSGNSYFTISGDPTVSDGDVVYYPDTYLYDEGRGDDYWVPGYSIGTGSRSKISDHLFLRAEGERTWTTETMYNLSNYSEVEVEWENTGESHEDNESHVTISDTQSSRHDTLIMTSHSTSGVFGRTTVTVDVSDITTDAYVKIHAVGGESSGDSELLTYSVRLI